MRPICKVKYIFSVYDTKYARNDNISVFLCSLGNFPPFRAQQSQHMLGGVEGSTLTTNILNTDANFKHTFQDGYGSRKWVHSMPAFEYYLFSNLI